MRATTTGRARRARLAVALVATVLAVLTAGTAMPATQQSADAANSAVTKTKEVIRQHVNEDGTEGEADDYTVEVTVEQTENLDARQRIEVSWTGARPSQVPTDRAWPENLAGAYGMEYPVLVVQCRGHDTAEEPLDPRNCLTSGRPSRHIEEQTLFGGDPDDPTLPANGAPWILDRYADSADRVVDYPQPRPSQCAFPAGSDSSFAEANFPFIDADGRAWYYCQLESEADEDPRYDVPPDVGTAGALPPNDQFVQTSNGGTGRTLFEVRTREENASLGCSAAVECSLVVVPIVGISCDLSLPTTDLQREQCTSDGGFTNYIHGPGDYAVSGQLWWSASNWENRISFPLSFAPTPDFCDIQDRRTPVDFYGSELMTQATLQWAPEFCLDPDRFKFRHQHMGEPRARALVDSGGAVAAFGSRPSAQEAERPTVYAPAAVSGFSIGYWWDKERPDPTQPAEEVTDLKLTPRLLAKLVTQSYRGSHGSEHPGVGSNPRDVSEDPEFQALNPDARNYGNGVASLASISADSDVVWELTRYIDADPAARAWLDGAPDENGMVVNPAFRGIDLPVESLPLLDDWKLPSDVLGVSACMESNPDTFWLNQLANPLSSLAETAVAVLERHPSGIADCESNKAGIGSWERADRGQAVMALVANADAANYKLHTAALQTQPGVFVEPNLGTIRTALRLTTLDEDTGTLKVDHQAIRSTEAGRQAYPGTMMVYTIAPTAGLSDQDAARVAEMMRFSVTDGQTPGIGNGQLPDGYLPINRQSGLGSFIDRTLALADEVENQTGEPPPPPDEDRDDGDDPPPESDRQTGGSGGDFGDGPGGDGSGSTSDVVPAGNDVTPGSDPPDDEPPDEESADTPPENSDLDAAEEALTTSAETRGDTSWLARWALPFLLLLGLLGGVLAPVVVAATRPGHPVRIYLTRLGATLRARVLRRA